MPDMCLCNPHAEPNAPREPNCPIHNSRVGDWIQTFTGLVMYPLDPRPEEICIEDIAHALSNLCRFTGHCREFYSVADHSVRVSYACDPQDALWGLLHDAPEAYLADMSRPVKRYSDFGTIYRKIEARLMDQIVIKFGLSQFGTPASVERADTALLMTEKRDLMHGCNKEWEDTGEPLKTVIRPLSPYDARLNFMRRFRELTADKRTSLSNGSAKPEFKQKENHDG
jgi:hypothetical protein